MIPLIVTEPELALLTDWVREVATDGAGEAGDDDVDYLVGTMIETPRAALVAGEIAEVAEFFSFGTNDLTQMTFGFSRDDVEGRFMSEYLELKLLPANPFETLDQEGVGQLVRIGVERGRATRPDIKLGICGEHGGDPASVRVLRRGRPRLRVVLAVPRADRPPRRGPRRPRRRRTGEHRVGARGADRAAPPVVASQPASRDCPPADVRRRSTSRPGRSLGP